ncbi:hypothetical protein HKX48_008924 [Thoreauomyces humboldtii]|nr:hypothetical protein HKX48_008924 [Thoreauomyces humboldtii]
MRHFYSAGTLAAQEANANPRMLAALEFQTQRGFHHSISTLRLSQKRRAENDLTDGLEMHGRQTAQEALLISVEHFGKRLSSVEKNVIRAFIATDVEAGEIAQPRDGCLQNNRSSRLGRKQDPERPLMSPSSTPVMLPMPSLVTLKMPPAILKT